MNDSGKRVGKVRELVGSLLERTVTVAAENYLENCVHTKVDIEALQRLMEPENEKVSLRYNLKYSTRGGSNIFQLF